MFVLIIRAVTDYEILDFLSISYCGLYSSEVVCIVYCDNDINSNVWLSSSIIFRNPSFSKSSMIMSGDQADCSEAVHSSLGQTYLSE